MSRESLLDKAIVKAKKAEDWQLVEWLRMARSGENVARWYSEKLREAHRSVRKVLDENAKLQQKLSICQESEQEKTIEYLREEIIDWEDKYRAIVADNVKLRKQANFEHFQLGEMKKAASMMLDEFVALETDNVKLKELVANYSAAAKYLCGHSHCNECNLDCASVFGDVPSGWDCARMLLDKRARELGVKVNYK